MSVPVTWCGRGITVSKNPQSSSCELNTAHCLLHDGLQWSRTRCLFALHDELFPLLRNMIVEGELDPGCRMPEKVLCADFGVSRTPLREVLEMLSVKGLVSLPPDRGASVVCITQQEAEDLILLLGTMSHTPANSPASGSMRHVLRTSRIARAIARKSSFRQRARAPGPLMRSSFSRIRGAEVARRRCENRCPHQFSHSLCPTDRLHLR